jgi:hypothetical protein
VIVVLIFSALSSNVYLIDFIYLYIFWIFFVKYLEIKLDGTSFYGEINYGHKPSKYSHFGWTARRISAGDRQL